MGFKLADIEGLRRPTNVDEEGARLQGEVNRAPAIGETAHGKVSDADPCVAATRVYWKDR